VRQHLVWWVEGTGSSLAAAPAPSLTVAGAPPPSCQLALAWGTAGSMRAARKATPERSCMVQGWATSPDTLTGWPWLRALGDFSYTLKAGPAGGRLRRPSSRRQRHDGHRRTGLTLPHPGTGSIHGRPWFSPGVDRMER
jgi:hypothetical protein